LGLQSGSDGGIDINDANMLYGGNMTSIEMIDYIEVAELLDVNNPFVVMEFIDLSMEEGPLPLSGQLVDNITVTGPGTVLLFDGEGNPPNMEDPNDFMGESQVQFLMEQLAEETSETLTEPASRAALPARTTHLAYCPPEPNIPFDSNSTDFEPNSFGNFESQRMMLGEDRGEQMLLDERPIIDVHSDITTNQIWTADNIYYIWYIINVRALLVIEPGTEIRFASYYSSLRVNNGGTLISCGTPDNMVWYTAGDPSEPSQYASAIVVEETASPATRIEYNRIEWACDGIVIRNNRLDNPIRNNVFYGPVNGILEHGPKLTDIVNNYFSDSANGIKVYLASENGVSDANSHILIENNTCDYSGAYGCDDTCGDGIVVYGTCEECEPGGYVMIADNIVADSYWYGIHLEGLASWGVYNTGYYLNGHEKSPWNSEPNWAGGNIWPADFEQVNPVEADELPFVIDSNGVRRCSLVPDCPFIDAGSQYIEDTTLVARTTDINGLPDCNEVDIGFHHSEYELWWHYVNAGQGCAPADINKDAVTDGLDLQVITSHWLDSVTPNDANVGNLNNDSTVNFKDYAIMAQTWYKIQGHPNITAQVSGNPANLSGNVNVNVANFGPGAWRAFVLMDGQFIREIIGFNDADEPGVCRIDSREYRNGQHEIKAVTVDYGGGVTVSPTIDVNSNNTLSVLLQRDSFTLDQPYHLCGIASGTYAVEVNDVVNETTVYSQNFTDGINAHIPASVFTEEDGLYDIALQGPTTVERTIGREFKLEDLPANSDRQMVVSIGSEDLEIDKAQCWKAAWRAAVLKDIKPIFLNYQACTWDRLSYCLQLPNVKMWYHCAHGGHETWYGASRQWIETAEGKVFSYLKKDFAPGQEPPDYEWLWFYEDNHSLMELGFTNTDKMIWVQFNACYSARRDEFAGALGIVPIKDPQHIGKQIFIGWKDSALVHDIIGRYNQFEEDYWNRLQMGQTLDKAVEWSLPPQGGTNIEDNFTYYGVIDWQFVTFNYPQINP